MISDGGMTSLTGDEIERLHDEGSAAAEHAWIGNMPPNPYRDDPERAEIWDYAFRNAYAEINT